MAKTRKGPLTPAAVAKRVVVREGGEIYTLPVNEGFEDPNTIDERRGVDYPDAAEVRLSERGMVLAVQRGVLPPNLAEWVRQQERRKGGSNRLAEELVAMDPDPDHAATDVRNMQRKLQEWTQTSHKVRDRKTGEVEIRPGPKYKNPSGRNARRVAKLVIIEADYVLLGVTGYWVMLDGKTKDGQELFRRFNTQPEHEQLAREVLQSVDAAEFIATVIAAANELVQPYEVELTHLHGLHVEVQR